MSGSHQQWRDQSINDMGIFIFVMAFLLIIVWIATGTPVDGASPFANPTVQPAPEAPSQSLWLENGSTGEDVKAVQDILASHGWTIAVDGEYGPQTEAVVTRFQEVSGIFVDGIVGSQTWSALQSVAVRGQSIQATQPDTAPVSISVGVNGDCDSWRSDIEAEGIPWNWAKGIIWREARCEGDAHNGNSSTGDHSHGLFQVNLLGSLGPWFAASGYSHDVVSTPIGAIKAAGALYEACGKGPWNRGNYYCSGTGKLRSYSP